MKNDDLLALVKNRHDTGLKNQKTKFDKFSEFDYIFNNQLKHYDPNIPSKIFNPILWSFIETVITRMLAKTPVIAYKPREENDVVNSQIFTDLFSYWFDKCMIYPKIVQWVKNTLIYGTAVVKVDWYTSPPRDVTSYVYDVDGTPQVDDKGNFVTQTTQVVEYDDPRLTPINIYDFFVDPRATNIEDAQWVIHQYWANIKDLEQENTKAESVGKRVYNKYSLDRIKRERQQNPSEYEQRRREATGLDGVPAQDTTVDRCLIWEMWENDRLIVIADGMMVLRDETNPFWHGKKPFIHLVDSVVPHSFWGKGEIEPVEKLLHALNTTMNQRVTNINRILAPMWKAKTTVDDDELNFIDNGIIHVTDMQDAEMVQYADVTTNAYQETEAIKNDIQRALGVTDLVQGLDTPAQTAQEVEIKTSQANARFAHKVKLFEEMGLKQLGEMVYQLYQQFLTKERVVRIVGSEGEKYIHITPQEIVGEYDVIPESQSTLATDSESEFQKFLNLFAILRQYVQQTNPGGVDPKTGQVIPPSITGFLSDQELVKTLLERSGEKDPKKFFVQQGNTNGQTTGDQATSGTPQVFGAPQGFGGQPGMAGMGG